MNSNLSAQRPLREIKSIYRLMKIKQEDGNKHKNPASFRAYQRIITSGLSFQGEVNREMDGVERRQPPLEVSILHRELLMGEEEQKAAERQQPCPHIYVFMAAWRNTPIC